MASDQSNETPALSEEAKEKLFELRSKLRGTMGELVMTLFGFPRYRHMAVHDLQSVIMEPLLSNRIAVARKNGDDEGMIGFAIWAKVSEKVDQEIREQIKARVFPVRLRPTDWNSGDIPWLLDVVAPDGPTTTAVAAGLRDEVGDTDLRLHPMVVELLDKDTVEKLVNQRKVKEELAKKPAEGPVQ